MPSIDPALPPSLRESAPSSLDDADRYLMWGMLVDAAEALVLGADDPWRDDEVLVSEIRDWVYADDPEWPFSFVNICAALEMEPGFVRDGLAAWLRRRAALPEAERRRIRNPFRRMNGSRHRPSGRPRRSRLELVR